MRREGERDDDASVSGVDGRSYISQKRPRFWRAAVAFLVLPGTVAFLAPWLLHPTAERVHVTAIPFLAGGIGLLLWCVRDFYVAGHGTIAPWSPPTRLVVVGLYRVSRNPMYIAVLIILCGWAIAPASRTIWIYAAVVAIAFHLRVIFGEEPWLARTHGAAWESYRTHVPRWFGLRSLRPHTNGVEPDQ
jgi:protein-S-isoprenylcysteine O-methyltransferase Ste14